MMNLLLFQFMIGNGDYFLPTIHNFKLFEPTDNEDGKLIALPYDFDYTGWVNTYYAVPRDEYGLEEIRDRAYLGPCLEREKLKLALEDFAAYEEQFIDTIKDFKYLNAINRRDLINYVKKFFRMYKDDEIVDIILRHCEI